MAAAKLAWTCSRGDRVGNESPAIADDAVGCRRVASNRPRVRKIWQSPMGRGAAAAEEWPMTQRTIGRGRGGEVHTLLMALMSLPTASARDRSAGWDVGP